MKTTSQKLTAAFELARRINEAMWMRGGPDPAVMLSVDDLKDYVSEEFGVEIILRTVDVETEFVLGFIMRYDGGKKACVYIARSTAGRKKRLVAVKEICHVVVDEPEDMSPNGVDTLQRLMQGFQPNPDAPENLAFRSEHIAEIAAIELLYPHEDRQAHMDALLAGQLNTAAVAVKYGIPEDTVKMVLNPPYLDMCNYHWAKVHEDRKAALLAERARREDRPSSEDGDDGDGAGHA